MIGCGNYGGAREKDKKQNNNDNDNNNNNEIQTSYKVNNTYINI